MLMNQLKKAQEKDIALNINKNNITNLHKEKINKKRKNRNNIDSSKDIIMMKKDTDSEKSIFSTP